MFDCAGMFDGNDGPAEEVIEEYEKYDAIHTTEPEWLKAILAVLDEAGRDPSWLDVREESENGNNDNGQ